MPVVPQNHKAQSCTAGISFKKSDSSLSHILARMSEGYGFPLGSPLFFAFYARASFGAQEAGGFFDSPPPGVGHKVWP